MRKMDSPIKKVRCAIYTRKSTEEGLDQDFNSLDAQWEAGIAYIQARQGEGWHALDDRYDDGGFTGGNMNRPALQRLLKDIKDHKIDVVVSYKFDRLSRSLQDFIWMMDEFKADDVSFVSVTQPIDTTTPMGTLNLNVNLSFSQYERELIAERVRDKVAASRKKGIWMGGVPPLGYDVDKRKLVVNASEVDRVRFIFERFLALGSVTELVKELKDKHYYTKEWTSTRGIYHPGKPINKKSLYHILRNRVYVGEATHKGQHYPGEHTGIVDKKLFDQVQAMLDSNRLERPSHIKASSPALLKGLIFTSEGFAMTPSHSRKSGKLYRYYVTTKAIKQGYGECVLSQVSSGEIEEIVIAHIEALFKSPEIIVQTWRATEAKGQNMTESEVRATLQNIHPLWEHLFPAEQSRIIRLLVERVVVYPEGVDIHFHFNGICSLAQEVKPGLDISPETQHQALVIRVPVRFRMRDGRTRIIVPDTPETEHLKSLQDKPDGGLVRNLVKAHTWNGWLRSGQVKSATALAKQEGVSRQYVTRVLKMTILAPDIQEAILNDTHPNEWAMKDFFEVPTLWSEQREKLVFNRV